jgi:hypothetical protein
MKSLRVPLLVFPLLAGCAPAPVYPLYTPVQVAGSFGYAEQRISAARYTVTYTAPVHRTDAFGGERRDQDADRQVVLAYDMALWRAAELALAHGYPAFRVAGRNNDVQVDVRHEAYFDPFPRFGHHHRYGRFPHGYPRYYPSYAYLAAGVTLAVEFRRRGAGDTFDARATRARLRAQYARATAPGSAGY